MPLGSQRLALKENEESRNKVDEILGACLALQKLYGRDVANTGTVIDLFQRLLADYPADKVIMALQTSLEKSQEFPTPSDIINLIKRDGKPPIKESDVIAIRKKDAELRTSEDWGLLREWEAQQNDSWGSNDYQPNRESWKDEEMFRLREQLQELRGENARAWAEVKTLRLQLGAGKPMITKDEKIKKTVDMMRQEGKTEEDIQEFLNAL